MILANKGYVLVRPDKEDEIQHGIVIPESAKEGPFCGTVYSMHNLFKTGGRVFYPKYAATHTLNVDEDEVIAIRETDIIAYEG